MASSIGVPQVSLLEAVRGDVSDVTRGLEMVSRALLAAAERCAAMEKRLDERQRRLDESWSRMEEKALALEATMTKRSSPEGRLEALEASVERIMETVFPNGKKPLEEESDVEPTTTSMDTSFSISSASSDANAYSSATASSSSTKETQLSKWHQDVELRWHANIGETKDIERLLLAGANPNSRNKKGRSALHCAVLRRSLKCIEVLVSHGADIDITDNNQETPLHYAARSESKEVAWTLLVCGASPSAKNSKGMTPLEVTTCDKIRELLRQCAATGLTSVAAHTYVNSADGSVNPVKTTKNECQQDVRLRGAANSGRLKEVIQLLLAGANPNSRNKRGCSALHCTAISRSPECAELLVTNGAVIDIEDDNKETPLHYAARRGCKETTRTLLEFGASTSAKNCMGQTPQDVARDKILEVFRMYAANSNVPEVSPATECSSLLHNKSISRNTDNSASLSGSKSVPARTNTSAISERTTEQKVLVSNVSKCAAASADLSIDDDSARERRLRLACRDGRDNEVLWLLAAGTSVHCVNACGQQPVHLAAIYDNVECLRHLLKYGADVTNGDGTSATPLHLAAKHKNTSAFNFLLPLTPSYITLDVKAKYPLTYALGEESSASSE